MIKSNSSGSDSSFFLGLPLSAFLTDFLICFLICLSYSFPEIHARIKVLAEQRVRASQLQAADDQREKDKAEQEGRGSGASARGKKVDQAPRRGSVMGLLQSVAKAATLMQSNRRSNPQVQPSDDVDDPEH